MRIRHALENRDRQRRIDYSNWLIEQFRDENFQNKIVIGDEAAFSMNGQVNSHNVVQYAPKGEAPDFHYDRNNSREKVTVWAAVCGNGTILGPYFFDANMNGQTYLNMINDDVVTEMMLRYNMVHHVTKPDM